MVNIFNIYHVKHANEVYLLIYSTYIKIRVKILLQEEVKNNKLYVIVCNDDARCKGFIMFLVTH